MAGEGASILETSPFVISLVFLFFLVITIGFEKAIELLEWYLEKWGGKEGLLAASKKMKTELMLLGFASLLLFAFENHITARCINANSSGAKTWLDHVHGCACCLTHTRGVSACYLAAKGCSSGDQLSECCQGPDRGEQESGECKSIFDTSENWSNRTYDSPYEVNVETGKAVFGKSYNRRLLAESETDSEYTQCVGRFEVGTGDCKGTDKKPVISQPALHQIHMLIFTIAISHIVISVVVIILSHIRVHWWHRMCDTDSKQFQMVQEVVDEFWTHIAANQAAEKVENQPPETVESVSSSVEVSKASSPSDELAVTSEQLATNFLPTAIDVERDKPWKGRPYKLRGVLGRTKELLRCFVQQVSLYIIKKEEFICMDSAFVLTHGIRHRQNHPFVFLEYIKRNMEEDFSKTVGLSLSMWIFVILFTVLSSAIGWCIWLFTVAAGIVLLVLNTKLVWIVRYVTRGGNINKLTPRIFWLHRPFLVLPFIQFLLFFISFNYANEVFFAAEFGSNSCFFSRDGFHGEPIPWWIFLIANTAFLASLGLVTLPLYSIVVQMGGDFKPGLLSIDAATSAMITADANFVHEQHRHDCQRTKGMKRMISLTVRQKRFRDPNEEGPPGLGRLSNTIVRLSQMSKKDDDAKNLTRSSI